MEARLRARRDLAATHSAESGSGDAPDRECTGECLNQLSEYPTRMSVPERAAVVVISIVLLMVTVVRSYRRDGYGPTRVSGRGRGVDRCVSTTHGSSTGGRSRSTTTATSSRGSGAKLPTSG